MYTNLDLGFLCEKKGITPTLSLTKTLNMDGKAETWYRAVYSRYPASKPAFGVEITSNGPELDFFDPGSVISYDSTNLLFLRPDGYAFCGEILTESSYRIYPVLFEIKSKRVTGAQTAWAPLPIRIPVDDLATTLPTLVATLRTHAAAATEMPPILLIPSPDCPFKELLEQFATWVSLYDPNLTALYFEIKNIRLDQADKAIRISTSFRKPNTYSTSLPVREQVDQIVKTNRVVLTQMITKDAEKGLDLLGFKRAPTNLTRHCIPTPSTLKINTLRFRAILKKSRPSGHEILSLVERFGPIPAP